MRNIKIKRCIYLFFFVNSSPIYAFNLQEAWVAAQKNSADYQEAFYQKNVIQEKQQQTKSVFFPHLSGNIHYQNQPHSSTSIKESYGWDLQLSQTLFNGNEIAKYRQSIYNSKAAEKNYNNAKEQLLYNVAENYFNLLLSNETIIAYTAEKISYEQQLKRAQALFDKGAATALDIHEAQAGYDSAVAQEIAAIAKRQILENQLNNYTGLDSKQIEPISILNQIDNYLLQVKKYSLDEWQLIALENNHKYLAQKYTVNSQEEALKAAKNSRLPTLKGQIKYQDTSSSNNYKVRGKERNTTIQLQVNIPLFTGGDLSSKINEAINQYEATRAQLVAIERQIKLAIRQAYTESNTMYHQILAQERVFKSRQLQLKSTETGKIYGMRNHLEVIRARQGVTEAEQKLAEAKYKFLMAYLTLIKESGLELEKNISL